MPTKEEAEAKADAILAAYRSSPEGTSARGQGKGGGGAAGVRWFMLAGFVIGAIVAVLPSHNFLIGGIVGIALGGIFGALASRRG